MSSPAPYPPSSLPAGTPQSSSLPQSRPVIDPLAYNDVHGLGGSIPNGAAAAGVEEADTAEDLTGNSGRRRGAASRFNDTEAIPRVKDATGEKVMESFALFLEK